MRIAEARKLELKEFLSIEELSVLMDKEQRFSIETINWKEFNYKPDVKFSIAHNDNEIVLKYYVKENYFKAEYTESNQNVYEDSCVEFFVSPEKDGLYYNFEFNGIGTCLMGSGTGRENRRTDVEMISKIRIVASAGNKPIPERHGEFKWTLMAAIPFEVFFHHKIRNAKGKTFRANFYKCGDKLSVPHYVTWNPVETKKPDFHQPEYFGEIRFI